MLKSRTLSNRRPGSFIIDGRINETTKEMNVVQQDYEKSTHSKEADGHNVDGLGIH
jgi:hypothetical protein